MSFSEIQPKIPVRMNKRTMYRLIRDLNGDMLPMVATLPKAETSSRIRHHTFKTKVKLRQTMNSWYDGHVLTLNKINRDQRKMQQTMLRLHYERLKLRNRERAQKEQKLEAEKKQKIIKNVVGKFRENVTRRRGESTTSRGEESSQHDSSTRDQDTVHSKTIGKKSQGTTTSSSDVSAIPQNGRNNTYDNLKSASKTCNENHNVCKRNNNSIDVDEKDGGSSRRFSSDKVSTKDIGEIPNNNAKSKGDTRETKVQKQSDEKQYRSICRPRKDHTATVVIVRKEGEHSSSTRSRKSRARESENKRYSKHQTVTVIAEEFNNVCDEKSRHTKAMHEGDNQKKKRIDMFDSSETTCSTPVQTKTMMGDTVLSDVDSFRVRQTSDHCKDVSVITPEKNFGIKAITVAQTSAKADDDQSPHQKLTSQSLMLEHTVNVDKQLPPLKTRRIGRSRPPTEYLRRLVHELQTIEENNSGSRGNNSRNNNDISNNNNDGDHTNNSNTNTDTKQEHDSKASVENKDEKNDKEQIRSVRYQKQLSVNDRTNSMFLKTIKEKYDPKSQERKRLQELRSEDFSVYKRDDRGDIVAAAGKPKLKTFLLPFEQERYIERRAGYLEKLKQTTEQQEQLVKDYIEKLPADEEKEPSDKRVDRDSSPQGRFSRGSSVSPQNVVKNARLFNRKSRTKSYSKQNTYEALKNCGYLRNVVKLTDEETQTTDTKKYTSWSRPDVRQERDIFAMSYQ